MAITWIRFNRAMKAQGIERLEFLPAPSRFQPLRWLLGAFLGKHFPLGPGLRRLSERELEWYDKLCCAIYVPHRG
jgi:hypothetical protein